MRRIIVAVALALVPAMPSGALAENARSSGPPPPEIVVHRAPVSLELPARAPLLAPLTVWTSAPAPREVRLNEDQWLVVGAAAVLGVVLLVIVVTAVTN
jgi:hypothetical protein